MVGVADSAFSFGLQAPGNAIPEERMARWSWGGFLLPWLWPFWNANSTLKLIALGAFIAGFFTLGLSSLALGIYFGISGNRIAARDRVFATTEDYVAVQHAWAQGGVIMYFVVIPMSVFLAFCSAIVSTSAMH